VARTKRLLRKRRRTPGRRTKKAPASATPFDLGLFQARIAATYGAKDAKRGLPGTFMYLAEEVGELAEALREPAKHDLSGEFADCLAWLVSLAHLAGVDLAAAVAKKYPGFCGCCGRSPCVCRTKP
jgi:NTP pyrophosphatase (non-canonical NTP hydrolase)